MPETSTASNDDNIATLEKISKGVSEIAARANKALVFISISKTREMPMGMVDPFEFFFGPGFRDPRRGQQQPQQQPRQQQQGLGSGFFVDLDKGYILTNNHVVDGADEISLKVANGETYKGTVVGRDQKTDVAVVQIKERNFKKNGLGTLSLANSERVNVGDFVIALGAPFGLEASLSFGVVSATGRKDLGITTIGDFIQTDAAINPGNSGGPLLNTSGDVIGINTAIYSRSGAYNGIGFAIPATLARRVAETLINDGKLDRAFIGVSPQQLDPELAKELGLGENAMGALVGNVVPDSPAMKGGIEPGDVITEVDGRPIRSPNELVNTIGLMKPGTRVAITYFREGKKRSSTIRLEKFPDEEGSPNTNNRDRDQPRGEAGLFGLSLTKVTPSLAQRYQFESKQGVVITGVESASAADRSGLQVGDVILSVNNKKISTPGEFINAAKGKQKVLIRLERSRQFIFVALRG
jgi:serine protease Do